MSKNGYKIEFYRRPSGRQPFLDWVRRIKDRRTKDRIDIRLQRVREGNLGNWKPIHGPLRELIFDFGPGLRIYFAIVDEVVVLLLVGSDKGDQQQTIKKAKEYLAQYIRGKG